MARYEIRGPEHAASYSIREQENKEATQLEAQNRIRLNQRTRDMAEYLIRGPEKIVGYCNNRTRNMAGYSTRGPEKMTGYSIRGTENMAGYLIMYQKIRPAIQSVDQKIRTMV